MTIFEKIDFYFKKQPVVVVSGSNSDLAFRTISFLLEKHFKKQVLIFEAKENLGKLIPFLKDSRKPVLVLTDFENKELPLSLPENLTLILNIDSDIAQSDDKLNVAEKLSFGVGDGAAFRASDIKIESGINFKLNYKGNVVPFWIEKSFQQKELLAILAAVAVGTVFSLNLVEISQSFNYYP